ncbi:MAG: glycosyl hydrolase family 18 protein, partial [Acidimicrobiales bacterium]
AEHWTEATDGSTGQILEIVSDDPTDAGVSQVRRFLVSALDLVVFFRGVADWSDRWATGPDGAEAGEDVSLGISAMRTAVRGAIVDSYAAVAAWVTPRLAPRLAGLVPRSAGLVPRSAGLVPRLAGLVPRLASRSAGIATPRHKLGYRRVGAIVVATLVLVLVAGDATTSLTRVAPRVAPHYPVVFRAPSEMGNVIEAATAPVVPPLPAASAPPAPAPPSLAGAAPLRSHEIFGYAPYWTLPESSGFEVKDLTTLAYFSVDANGDGTLNQSGPGWNGYESQDLADLVTRAHATGDRVVLTVSCFNQQALNQITSDPNAVGRLSSALIAAVTTKNLDGVNFDFEAQGSGDRKGLTNLITQVSSALHGANPHWQVTIAVSASAAADSAGFYNVAALAPAVDGFFVMAYDMNDPVTPSTTAPLVGGGYNDTETLKQYTSVIPASKVILGVPYYGYDWPTTDGAQSARSTGPPTPVSYGVIAAGNTPTYWDQSTQTAWTSYQVGSQWHETYFDNPTSLALKAELANSFHIRGLGIWALGMDGNDPAMLAALLGQAPVVKDFTPGPTSTSTSPSTTTTSTTTPSSTGYTYSGVWQGQTVTLTPVSTRPAGTSLGTLSAFRTNDPHLTCLQTGPSLEVWSSAGDPNTDFVTASQPQNCATAVWSFPVHGGQSGTGGSTTPGSPTTTTTAPNLLGIPLAGHTSPAHP